MGIDCIHAEMLLAEHRYKAIKGDLLTISRNTISMTPESVVTLLKETGTAIRPGVDVTLDQATVHSCGSNALISDQSFYALFSDARLLVLDVSDYEKADIVHDMSLPVDASLENRFDFVINGSCLDNIFNPVTALQNTARMLRPGGRLFQFEWCNSHPTAYLKYSPDWFLDYFAVNKFADCKVYLLHYYDLQERAFYTGEGVSGIDLYLYDPLVYADGQTGYQCSHLNSYFPSMAIIIAEKGKDSTWDKSPIQMHYRSDPWHKETCLVSAQRFKASPRPIFSRNGRGRECRSSNLSRYGTLKPVVGWKV